MVGVGAADTDLDARYVGARERGTGDRRGWPEVPGNRAFATTASCQPPTHLFRHRRRSINGLIRGGVWYRGSSWIGLGAGIWLDLRGRGHIAADSGLAGPEFVTNGRLGWNHRRVYSSNITVC